MVTAVIVVYLIISLNLSVYAIPLKCPKLSCYEPLFKKRCYESNYQLAKEQHIRTWPCETNKLCRYESKEFVPLWPIDKWQMAATSLDMKNLDLWGYCTDVYSWETGHLLPGRSCSHSYQCLSNYCYNGKCKGSDEEGTCRTTADCSAGLICKNDAKNRPNFVDRNVCRKPIGDNEVCISDDDCEIKELCMKIQNINRCSRAFIRKDGEEAQDGRQCVSGAINNRGKCSTTKIVKHGGSILKSPFQCTPDSEKVCTYFDGDGLQNTFSAYLSLKDYTSQNSCQCTNITQSGESYGFCNPLGNEDWRNFLTFYFEEVLPFIKECHIMDRWNPIAWMDCGESVTNQEATKFVTMYKKLSYYQWMQDEKSEACVKNVITEFGNSWDLILDAITDGGSRMAIMTLAIILSTLIYN